MLQPMWQDEIVSAEKACHTAKYQQIKQDIDCCYSLIEKINRIENYIVENFKSDLSREGMAAAFDLSPDYMSRAYKLIKGNNMFDFIRELRLQHSLRLLLEQDKSVAEISFCSGFESIRTYNRLFKRRYGITPTVYKKRCQISASGP